MPVILAAQRVEGPVGRLGVEENNARVEVFLISITPHVPVAILGVLRMIRITRGLKPGVLIRGVVGDQLHDDPQITAVGFLDQPAHVVQRAVVGMHSAIISHVVAVITQGRREDRQHPDRVHTQPLKIVQLRSQTGQVADAVAIAVGEGADEDLVEDGVFVPERIRMHAVTVLEAGRRA